MRLNKYTLWISKIKFIVLFSLVSIFQAVEAAPDISYRHGEMVSVGLLDYHVFCTGSGQSTIILESGLGGNYLDWSLLQPILSKNAVVVCSYDRAGYGWSSMGEKPRLATRAASEFNDWAAQLKLPRPITFVGHSYGGLIGVAISNLTPRSVDGLVFLDSMHPNQFERLKNEANADLPAKPSRAIIFSSPEVIGYGLPESLARTAYQISRKPKVRSTLYNELRNVKKTMLLVDHLKWDQVPAMVLAHGRRDWDSHSTDGLMEDVWMRLQQDIAARSSGQLFVVDGGHQLQLDNPEDCAEYILRFHLARVQAFESQEVIEPRYE